MDDEKGLLGTIFPNVDQDSIQAPTIDTPVVGNDQDSGSDPGGVMASIFPNVKPMKGIAPDWVPEPEPLSPGSLDQRISDLDKQYIDNLRQWHGADNHRKHALESLKGFDFNSNSIKSRVIRKRWENEEENGAFPQSKEDLVGELAALEAAESVTGEQHRNRQVAIEHQIDLIKKTKKLMEAPEKGEVGALKQLWLGGKNQYMRDFATLGIGELRREFKIMDIAKRGAKDIESLTPEEKGALEMYKLFEAVQQGKDLSTWYNIGNMTVAMLPYMMEFAMTGGVASGVKAGVKAGLKTGAKKTASNLVKKAVGYTLGAVAQSQVMPMQYTDYAQRRTDQYEIEGSGEDLTIALKDDAENAFASGYKAIVTGTMETFSEGMGEILSKPVSKIAGGWAKKYMYGEGAGALLSGVQKFKRAAKFDGAAWEYIEENINGVGQAILTGDRSLKDVFNKEEQFEIFMSTLLMGNAFRVAELPGQAQVYTMQRKYDAADKQFQETIPANIGFQVLEALNDKTLKDQRAIMSKIDFDSLSKEQQHTVYNYIVARTNYDMVKGGIRAELDEKVQGLREKETGHIVSAMDKEGNQYLINERVSDQAVIATNVATNEKVTLPSGSLTEVASVPFEQYMAEQTEQTFSELFSQGEMEVRQTAAEVNTMQSPVQVGHKFRFNGIEYAASEIGEDGTVFGISLDQDVVDPVKITPDQLQGITPLDQEGNPVELSQESQDVAPEVDVSGTVGTENQAVEAPRSVTVGNTTHVVQDNGDGSFSLKDTFTDKQVATEKRDQLEDMYEGRGLEVTLETAPSDPADILSPSVYSIRISPGVTSQADQTGNRAGAVQQGVESDQPTASTKETAKKTDDSAADKGSGQESPTQEKPGAGEKGSAQATPQSEKETPETGEKKGSTEESRHQKNPGRERKFYPNQSLKGKRVKIQTTDAETGKKSTREYDALSLQRKLRKRQKVIEQLKDCVG